jgi:hypothetical protein
MSKRFTVLAEGVKRGSLTDAGVGRQQAPAEEVGLTG